MTQGYQLSYGISSQFSRYQFSILLTFIIDNWWSMILYFVNSF